MTEIPHDIWREVLSASDPEEDGQFDPLPPEEPPVVPCSLCGRLIDAEQASLGGGLCDRCYEEAERAAERAQEEREKAEMKEILDRGVCVECGKPVPREKLLQQGGMCADCESWREGEWERQYQGRRSASFRDEWYCYRCDIAFEGRPLDGGPGKCPICGAEAGSSRFTKPMWEVLEEDRKERERRLREEQRREKGGHRRVVATYQVRILYNRSTDFMSGYKPGDVLEEVGQATVEAPDQIKAAEEVYRRWQHGAAEVGLPEDVPENLRSMSVGDVLVFEDGSMYSVERRGFRRLTRAERTAANYTADGKVIVDGFTVLGEDEDEEDDSALFL